MTTETITNEELAIQAFAKYLLCCLLGMAGLFLVVGAAVSMIAH